MKKIGFSAVLLLCAYLNYAQSIKTFEPLLHQYQLGDKLQDDHLQKIIEPLPLAGEEVYLVKYDSSRTLYGRPVQKLTLRTRNDIITSIDIFIPFDTVLHKEMEMELGEPEFGWMAVAPGADTHSVISTRFWDLPNYSIAFKCTRYQYLLGDVKEDLIAISFIKCRIK